jgi:hypothetical protein
VSTATVSVFAITLPAPAVMLGIFPMAKSGSCDEACWRRCERWYFASRVPSVPVDVRSRSR